MVKGNISKFESRPMDNDFFLRLVRSGLIHGNSSSSWLKHDGLVNGVATITLGTFIQYHYG